MRLGLLEGREEGGHFAERLNDLAAHARRIGRRAALLGGNVEAQIVLRGDHV